ncbi:MAG: AI-2E family transporter [Chloroflexota bacterium]|nr:AI-2E family transporter [Chloroflexota bacterium]
MSSITTPSEIEDAPAEEPDGSTLPQPPGPQPPGVRFSPRTKAVVAIALLALAVFFVYGVRAIIWPFIWAGALAYLLAPLVTWLCKHTRLHRFWVTLILMGFFFGGIVLLFTFGYPPLSRELEGLRRSLPSIVENLESTIATYAQVDLFGLEAVIGSSGELLAGTLDSATSQVIDAALGIALHVVELALKFLLCLFATFYLLLESNRFGIWARRMVPAPYRQEVSMLGGQIDRMVGRFIRGQLMLVVIMSVATYIGLRILGVPYALVLAPAAGFLELIPFIGPVLAATPAVLLALVYPSPYGWSPVVYAVIVALMYTVMRHIEDYLIIPNVVGRYVQLNPVLTLFAILSGGALFGISGMLLAIPTAAILRIVLSYLYVKLTT